jgi:predicted O-methyltransferase YrrM
MSASATGYVEGITYTHGYYRELCPTLLALVALNRRQQASDWQPLRYLELGFGQGESLAIHAAACPGEFWGTDLNPAHVANARALVEASGSNAQIFELSFAELAARDDLPEFDVIALHGVWSWISDANRAVIVELIKRKLALGGLVYLSYNSMPGWAASQPLRELMALHAHLAEPDDIAQRIDGALAYASQLQDAGAFYFQANPDVAERLKGLLGKDRHYLAHEYFNRDWHPQPFAQVATQLAEAGLSFAGSANLLDHVDEAMLSPPGLALLNQTAHPLLRETARDLLINQQFRRDVFIKGIRPLPAPEQSRRYLAQRFVLPMPADNVPMAVRGPMGEINLHAEAFQPLLAALADNSHAPKSVDELLAHPLLERKALTHLRMALTILCGAGYIAPAQPKEAVAEARPRCDALNAHLLQQARSGAGLAFLASPVSGGGVSIGRKQQLFLQARAQGLSEPEQWAQHAWPALAAQGQTVLDNGQSLQDGIADIARSFAAKALPILQALGIT